MGTPEYTPFLMTQDLLQKHEDIEVIAAVWKTKDGEVLVAHSVGGALEKIGMAEALSAEMLRTLEEN